jgi:uncharacterized protein YggT (Ycf19 family)
MTVPEQILPEDSSLLKGLRFSRWFVWFVWAYIAFVVLMLTLAFFLLLFNANADNSFVEWVFRSSDRAMEPFRGIFPTETVGNGSVIDFSILFAIVVYGIIAMLISALVSFLDRKIAEERSKALYVAQEQERRREAARAANVHETTAQRLAAQEAAAQQLAVQQTAAQERTAEAAERVANQQPEPSSEPPPPPQG